MLIQGPSWRADFSSCLLVSRPWVTMTPDQRQDVIRLLQLRERQSPRCAPSPTRWRSFPTTTSGDGERETGEELQASATLRPA